MKQEAINNGVFDTDPYCDLEFEEIKQIQDRLSKTRGYQVGFYEAQMHYHFDRVDEKIKEINSHLKGLPVAVEYTDDGEGTTYE